MPAFLRLRRPRRLLSRGMRPVSSRFYARFLVLQAHLSLSLHVRAREREEEKREREKDSLFLSPFVSSTLSFFLFLSLFPPIERIPLVFAQLSPTLPLFLSLPLLAFSTVLSLTGLTHFPPLPRSGGASALRFSFSVILRMVLFPFVLLFSRGWFSTRVRARVSLPLAATAPTISPYRTSLFPFSSSFFCPCRSRCCALFEFKRGSHRCLVSSSQMNERRVLILLRRDDCY